MPKKSQIKEHSVKDKLLNNLDFSQTKKQVDALMKTVLQDNTLNTNKIQFIKEQLHDQRYQINPKMIANKMLEHLDNNENILIEIPA